MARAVVSDADRARVRAAVAAAEANTSGEIFAVVAEECDDYRFIPLAWATLAALVVPLPLIFLTLWPASAIWLAQLLVFLALAAGLSLPTVKPLVVPRRTKRAAVRALAAEQFLAHGLHTTEARTGVLIFVALAERHAEIIADTGIASKVDGEAWQGAMDKLVAGVAAGRIGDGLIAAIEAAGTLLARHFPRKPGDHDELPDDLVIL